MIVGSSASGVTKSTYAEMLIGQVDQAIQQRGPGDLARLFKSADTWVVADNNGSGNGH